MKYMQNGGFQNNPLMRQTLLWTEVFLTGLWISNFFFYFSKMSLTPQSVVDYYRGSEALFTQPRSFQSMVEVTHMHLPMMAIVVLLLTHLLIFAPMSESLKKWGITITFGAAFLNEASSWLVRFVAPEFAWLKIAAFLTVQTTMALLLAALAAFLIRAPQTGTKSPRAK